MGGRLDASRGSAARGAAIRAGVRWIRNTASDRYAPSASRLCFVFENQHAVRRLDRGRRVIKLRRQSAPRYRNRAALFCAVDRKIGRTNQYVLILSIVSPLL